VTSRNNKERLEDYLQLLSDEALSYLREGFELEWKEQAVLFSEGNKTPEALAAGHVRMALLLNVAARIEAVRTNKTK
jgi:hypothetical protein